jgi:hypothetical protein
MGLGFCIQLCYRLLVSRANAGYVPRWCYAFRISLPIEASLPAFPASCPFINFLAHLALVPPLIQL